MALNHENFQKASNYNFNGIYRALVEDNDDPSDSGKVRVRVFGIHSFESPAPPVNKLPWALPALGLSWSGGYNIKNKDYKNSSDAIVDGRYEEGNQSMVLGAGQNSKEFTPDNSDKSNVYQDAKSNACATGGDFVVPKRGNWVFVFFEGGNHEYPVYFATAPLKRDWDFTKEWRTNKLDSKIQQIEGFKDNFEPRDEALPDKSSWAKEAKVDSQVDKPKLKVIPPKEDGKSDRTNKDIQCVTSANGTTIIVDNQSGKEQIFVIHKNYMEYTDKDGNRKIYVGKKRVKEGQVTESETIANDSETPSNYEIGVEGNHELHILGNFDLYVKGRTHIQCDSHVQIDAKSNVGVVVREGDVDLIVEKGNVNADIAGNVNAEIKENLNAHVVKNTNIKVDGDLNATVNGSSDFTLTGKVKIQSSDDVNLIANNVLVQCTELGISGNVKIDGTLEVSRNTSIGGSLNAVGNTVLGSNLSVTSNVSCGGSLRNRGPVDLGSPVILRGVQVLPGIGTGAGGIPVYPTSPNVPTTPSVTEKTDSSIVNAKVF